MADKSLPAGRQALASLLLLPSPKVKINPPIERFKRIMFHLTPQERMALSCLLTIFCVGSLISFGLKRDANSFRWIKSVSQEHRNVLINLNKATVAELDRLPGIGIKTAGKIIDYRQAHGDFTSIDGLKKIKGITKRNFERLEGKLVL